MPKLLIRIVALGLIACLIADPATAAEVRSGILLSRTPILGETRAAAHFNQQALIGRLSVFYNTMTRGPSKRFAEVGARLRNHASGDSGRETRSAVSINPGKFMRVFVGWVLLGSLLINQIPNAASILGAYPVTAILGVLVLWAGGAFFMRGIWIWGITALAAFMAARPGYFRISNILDWEFTKPENVDLKPIEGWEVASKLRFTNAAFNESFSYHWGRWQGLKHWILPFMMRYIELAGERRHRPFHNHLLASIKMLLISPTPFRLSREFKSRVLNYEPDVRRISKGDQWLYLNLLGLVKELVLKSRNLVRCLPALDDLIQHTRGRRWFIEETVQIAQALARNSIDPDTTLACIQRLNNLFRLELKGDQLLQTLQMAKRLAQSKVDPADGLHYGVPTLLRVADGRPDVYSNLLSGFEKALKQGLFLNKEIRDKFRELTDTAGQRQWIVSETLELVNVIAEKKCPYWDIVPTMADLATTAADREWIIQDSLKTARDLTEKGISPQNTLKYAILPIAHYVGGDQALFKNLLEDIVVLAEAMTQNKGGNDPLHGNYIATVLDGSNGKPWLVRGVLKIVILMETKKQRTGNFLLRTTDSLSRELGDQDWLIKAALVLGTEMAAQGLDPENAMLQGVPRLVESSKDQVQRVRQGLAVARRLASKNIDPAYVLEHSIPALIKMAGDDKDSFKVCLDSLETFVEKLGPQGKFMQFPLQVGVPAVAKVAKGNPKVFVSLMEDLEKLVIAVPASDGQWNDLLPWRLDSVAEVAQGRPWVLQKTLALSQACALEGIPPGAILESGVPTLLSAARLDQQMFEELTPLLVDYARKLHQEGTYYLEQGMGEFPFWADIARHAPTQVKNILTHLAGPESKKYESMLRQLSRQQFKLSPDEELDQIFECLTLFSDHSLVPTNKILHTLHGAQDRPALISHWEREIGLIENGLFDPAQDIHVELSYTLMRRRMAQRPSIARDIGYEDYLKIVEEAKAGRSERFSPKEDAELSYLVLEAACLYVAIQEAKERADAEGRPFWVIENLSYGAVALAPIKRLLLEQGIPVISTKVSSSQSHHNPIILNPDLLTESDLHDLVALEPMIVIVDASDSVRKDGDGNYSDASQGWRNFIATVTEAMGHRGNAEEFQMSETVLTQLRQSPEYQLLTEKVRRFGVDSSSSKPYRMGFWTPSEKRLALREHMAPVRWPPKMDLTRASGPTLVMTQTAMEHEAIVRLAARGGWLGKLAQETLALTQGMYHDAAYYDDKDNFARIQIKITSRGPELNDAFFRSAEKRYHTLMNIPHAEPAAMQKIYDLILLDVDGTLTDPLQPINEQMMSQLVQFLEVGTHLAIVTNQGMSELRQNVLDPLEGYIRRHHLPLELLDRLHAFPAAGTQRFRFSRATRSWENQYDLATEQMTPLQQNQWKNVVKALLPEGAEFIDRDGFGTLHGVTPATRDDLLEQLNQSFVERELPLTAVVGGGNATVDILVHGAGKSTARNRILEELGLNLTMVGHRLMVVGDRFGKGPTSDAGLIIAGARNISVGGRKPGDHPGLEYRQRRGWRATFDLFDEVTARMRGAIPMSVGKRPTRLEEETVAAISRKTWWVGAGTAVGLGLATLGINFLWQVFTGQPVIAWEAAMGPFSSLLFLGFLRRRIDLSVRHSLAAGGAAHAPPVLLPPHDGKTISRLFGFTDVRRMSVDYVETVEDPTRPGYHFLAVSPANYDELLKYPITTRMRFLLYGVPGHEIAHRFFGKSEIMAYGIAQILPFAWGFAISFSLGGGTDGIAGILVYLTPFFLVALSSLIFLGFHWLLPEKEKGSITVVNRVFNALGRVAGILLLVRMAADAEARTAVQPLTSWIIAMAALLGNTLYFTFSYRNYDDLLSIPERKQSSAYEWICTLANAVMLVFLVTGQRPLAFVMAAILLLAKFAGVNLVGRRAVRHWNQKITWVVQLKAVAVLFMIGINNFPGKTAVGMLLVMYILNLLNTILDKALKDPNDSAGFAAVEARSLKAVSEPFAWRINRMFRPGPLLREKPALAQALAVYIAGDYIHRTIGTSLNDNNPERWKAWLKKTGTNNQMLAFLDRLTPADQESFFRWLRRHPLSPWRQQSDHPEDHALPLWSALWRDWNPNNDAARTAEEAAFGTLLCDLNPLLPKPVVAPDLLRSVQRAVDNALAVSNARFPLGVYSLHDAKAGGLAVLANEPGTFPAPFRSIPVKPKPFVQKLTSAG